MSNTFATLGLPFPLFQAPVSEASEYVGINTCSICQKSGVGCFSLGIGCALILTCPACGTENGLDADGRDDGNCRRCDAVLPFPDISGDVLSCHGCLRSGKAAITKDTELGMISWEQAFEGVTHGLPGLHRSDFELVPNGDWTGVRLPQALMFELLRTPTYATWQCERWLFCCRSPMVYLGSWDHAAFSRHAPDGDGRRYFAELLPDASLTLWDTGWEDFGGVYAFRCQHCGRERAHYDLS